jgi:hypothetical protein
MVDTLNLKIVDMPDDPPCSFCKTSRGGRIVIINTPHNDTFMCSDCIIELHAHIMEIRTALADPSRRN